MRNDDEFDRGEELDSRGKKRSLYWSVNHEPSETVQSDAHLADIKNILAQWGVKGDEQLDMAAMQFADVSEFTDYHDVMLNVKAAETEFMKLPSKVREIFGHSVEVWLDTAHDEDKRDALVTAGFLERVEVGDGNVKKGAPAAAPGAAKVGEQIEIEDKGSE